MSLDYKKEQISDGIAFTSIIDSRFKTNFISVCLINELNAEAAMNAVLMPILSKSNKEYKTLSEISRKLTGLYGASLHGDVAKFGDSQCLLLNGSCIADRYTFDKDQVTNELADIILKCLLNPNIDSNQFNTLNFNLNKQELIDEIDADINDKRTYALMRAGKNIFSGEPAGLSSHGEREDAVKMTSEDVYNQYKNILETSQIEIFFAGGGDSCAIKEKFSTALAAIKRNYTEKFTSKFSIAKEEPVKIIDTLDIAQSKMVIAFKSQGEDQPALRLMNAIYGGTPFSKLFENVREKMSLCYYCSSSYDERKGVLYIDSGVEHENIEKAENEIINQLGEIANGNFTDDEINNSRLSLINSYRSVNDSPYSLVSWYLKCTYNNDIITPEQQIERINAVTRDDIINAAKSLKKDTVYILTGKGGEK